VGEVDKCERFAARLTPSQGFRRLHVASVAETFELIAVDKPALLIYDPDIADADFAARLQQMYPDVSCHAATAGASRSPE
jgi:hypothetical protein